MVLDAPGVAPCQTSEQVFNRRTSIATVLGYIYGEPLCADLVFYGVYAYEISHCIASVVWMDWFAHRRVDELPQCEDLFGIPFPGWCFSFI